MEILMWELKIFGQVFWKWCASDASEVDDVLGMSPIKMILGYPWRSHVHCHGDLRCSRKPMGFLAQGVRCFEADALHQPKIHGDQWRCVRTTAISAMVAMFKSLLACLLWISPCLTMTTSLTSLTSFRCDQLDHDTGRSCWCPGWKGGAPTCGVAINPVN